MDQIKRLLKVHFLIWYYISIKLVEKEFNTMKLPSKEQLLDTLKDFTIYECSSVHYDIDLVCKSISDFIKYCKKYNVKEIYYKASLFNKEEDSVSFSYIYDVESKDFISEATKQKILQFEGNVRTYRFYAIRTDDENNTLIVRYEIDNTEIEKLMKKVRKEYRTNKEKAFIRIIEELKTDKEFTSLDSKDIEEYLEKNYSPNFYKRFDIRFNDELRKAEQLTSFQNYIKNFQK